MVKAVGLSLPISVKHSVEICNHLRKKNLQEAKEWLTKVAEGKTAVPYKRFNRELSHKRKIGPGRFPIKTTEEILKVVKQVEANAQFQGISTANLYIYHINAQKASRPMHFGRQRGQKTKRTHIEIVVKEGEKKKATEKTKKVKKDKVATSSTTEKNKSEKTIIEAKND